LGGHNYGNIKSISKIQSKFCGRRISWRAGALNQAIKAIAIARGFVAPSGIDLVCIPAFTDITVDGEERTAIKLLIQSR